MNHNRFIDLRVLEGHSAWVTSLAFDRDGTTLASGGWDHTVRLWDVPSGSIRQVLRSPRPYVRAVAFSSDGALLGSGGGYDAHPEGAVTLWETATGRERRTVPVAGGVRSLVFVADGRAVAVDGGSDTDYAIALYDVASGREVSRLKGSPNRILALASNERGEYLASGDAVGVVTLWGVAEGIEQMRLQAPGDVIYSLALSRDARLLAAGTDRGATMWEITSGAQVWHLDTADPSSPYGIHDHNILGLSFNGDGTMLACGTADDAEQAGAVVLLRAGTGAAVHIEHALATYAVAFHPSQNLLAAAGLGENVYMWQVS